MSAHGTPANGHPTKSNSSYKGIVSMGVIGLLFIILFRFFFLSSDKSSAENETQDSSNSQAQTSQSYSNIITVNYGPSYGEIIYLPSGCDIFFAEATESYCCMNADNVEACGKTGEDASSDFPGGSANKKLRFKSSNGKDGSIKIILTKTKN